MLFYFKYLILCISAILFVSCKDLDTNKFESPRIYSFAVINGYERYEGIIDEVERSINVEVPMTVSLDELITEVTYSEGFELTPADGYKVAFKDVVPFRLENKDGKFKSISSACNSG